MFSRQHTIPQPIRPWDKIYGREIVMCQVGITMMTMTIHHMVLHHPVLHAAFAMVQGLTHILGKMLHQMLEEICLGVTQTHPARNVHTVKSTHGISTISVQNAILVHINKTVL